jgi:hypothetical protein
MAIALTLLCAVTAAAVVVVIRRRRLSSDDPEAVLRAARRAIAESARDQRQRSKGTIRGKGQGGDGNLAIDSGLGSDSGGAP